MPFDRKTQPPSCSQPLSQRSFARRVEDLLQAICEDLPQVDTIATCIDLGDYTQVRIGVLRRAATLYLPARTRHAMQTILFESADAAKKALQEWRDINDVTLDFIAERRRAMKGRHESLERENASSSGKIPAATPPGAFAPVVKLHHADPAFIPARAHDGDAAFDLRAFLPKTAKVIRHPSGHDIQIMPIKAGETVKVPTGLTIAVPPGYELQVRPRSGASLRGMFLIPNSPGTVDSGYRSEIQIIVHALQDFVIEHGDRIAQAVIAPIALPTFVPVANVSDLGVTERGAGGFGSTGTK